MPGRPHRRHAEQCIQRILSRTGEGEGRGTGRIEQRRMNILAVKYHQARAAIRSRFPAMTQRRTDPSAIHTWLVLMKAHRTLSRHATRSIEALDMCLSDFAILEALLHKGPQPARELARPIDPTTG